MTHLGSASTRDAMHADRAGCRVAGAGEGDVSDSMRMFQWGLEGGKPEPGREGVQPEWFYKGDGTCLAPPGQALCAPAFGMDFGEEPEIAALYVVAGDGTPCRVGSRWVMRPPTT